MPVSYTHLDVYKRQSYDWVIEELDEFEKRTGDMFYITEETKERLKAIAPYWKGKTHADEVQENLPHDVKQAQKQNVIHCGGISMSGLSLIHISGGKGS